MVPLPIPTEQAVVGVVSDDTASTTSSCDSLASVSASTTPEATPSPARDVHFAEHDVLYQEHDDDDEDDDEDDFVPKGGPNTPVGRPTGGSTKGGSTKGGSTNGSSSSGSK